MRKLNKFTREQVKTLAANPYTSMVDFRHIWYTEEFMKLFWDRYKNGDTSFEIFDSCGYDIEVLGENRVYGFPRRVTRLLGISHEHTGIAEGIRTAERSGTTESTGAIERTGTVESTGAAESSGTAERSGTIERTGTAERSGTIERTGIAERTEIVERIVEIRPQDTEDDTLSTQQTVSDMQRELKYLRQQIELLKKTVETDNDEGPPGD